jgi:hypothetical protein
MSEVAHLQFKREKRPHQIFASGASKTEREFLDFVVNGISLWQLCKEARLDAISCVWLPNVYAPAVRRLLLQEPADFADGRISLYVCAECGDIGCGAVSLRITMNEEVVTWSDFAYQNNYDESMTYKLDNFDVIDPVSFDIHEYRAMLMVLTADGTE